MLGMQKVKIIS